MYRIVRRLIGSFGMSSPPNNFSWVSDSVAGFAFPYTKENLNFLVNESHITHLFTLSEDKPGDLDLFPNLTSHFYPVEEFAPGDLGTVREIVEIIADAECRGEKSGVHCQFGQMRTGTILAAYLAYHHKINGKEAIKMLKTLRPKSLFSVDSENVICAYANTLKKK
nr:dual specificity phosphatase [Hymenolepis microstoma]